MNRLQDEEYLLNLFEREYLIDPEQRKLICNQKNQQRQMLLRKNPPRRRKTNGTTPPGYDPDIIDIIVSMNLECRHDGTTLLTEEMMMQCIARDVNLPFQKLDPLKLDINVVTKTIPKTFALKHLILPFAVSNGVLKVAIYNPASQAMLEEIERVNQLKVNPYIATKSDILKILGEFYGFQSSITAAESHLGGATVDISNLEQYVRIASSEEAAMSDKHIQTAVDHLFSYAFEQRASDIHLEPKRKDCLVRLRIDGALHTIYTLPKVVHPAIVSRIKFLSRLDITEKRRPQDGRIKVDRGGKEAEIRVSTIPVVFGEKVVMRILDPDIVFQRLDQLGFSERDYKVFSDIIESPHGIFLVTGPTGSGKSTTLYSTLKHVASPDKNIVTVEDPVEMVYEDFNQVAVQTQVDVSFSSILRNILRQDPDIIMIGEIRDKETAAHAVQAALTGHLVLSTLHTNDAVSSITRLLDLGVQSFLVGSTLIGVMAQRLVRRICRRCVQEVSVNAAFLRTAGLPLSAGEGGEITLHKGKGCRDCRDTGYFRRSGIFEIFPISEPIITMINEAPNVAAIREKAIDEGMTTLKEDVWQKVKSGVTTYEEALRVVGGG